MKVLHVNQDNFLEPLSCFLIPKEDLENNVFTEYNMTTYPQCSLGYRLEPITKQLLTYQGKTVLEPIREPIHFTEAEIFHIDTGAKVNYRAPSWLKELHLDACDYDETRSHDNPFDGEAYFECIHKFINIKIRRGHTINWQPFIKTFTDLQYLVSWEETKFSSISGDYDERVKLWEQLAIQGLSGNEERPVMCDDEHCGDEY